MQTVLLVFFLYNEDACAFDMKLLSGFDQMLSHGNTPYNGRLEIYHGAQWGTVCDDGFGDIEASVVCRYLELSWLVIFLIPQEEP